jgi:hypothetical protein
VRGAVDLEPAECRLAALIDWVASEPHRNQLLDAIKAVVTMMVSHVPN